MSTHPQLSTTPPVPRATHSPRSPLVPQSEDPPDDEPSHQPQPQPGDVDADDEDEIPYPEPSSEQMLLPPPNFRPFFTLIEDTTSGEHYHPYLHYVFADDDPVILTAASMRALGLDDTKYLPQDAAQDEEKQQRHEDEEIEQDSPVESPLPPPIPGVKEHYLIIDVGADGRTIIDAQSLSSEWQITNTSVRTAPSFDENSPDQGFMLQIEGVDLPRKSKGKGKTQAGQDKLGEAREKSQGDIFGALDGLVQSVEGGLDVAGKISGTRPKEREADTVIDVRGEEEAKGLASES